LFPIRRIIIEGKACGTTGKERLENLDAKLFERCRKGDADAFRPVVRHHQEFAYAVAFRILQHEEDARDAVQESFVRAWNHISKFDERKSFSTWLYRIVMRLCYDRLKSRKRKQEMLERFSNETVAPADDPDERLERREMTALIRELIGQLPPRQRMVFVLRDIEDMSVRQVSEILKMPAHSVKSNLYYARKNIRKKLMAFSGGSAG